VGCVSSASSSRSNQEARRGPRCRNFVVPSSSSSPESVMIHSSLTISNIGEVSIGFRVSIRTLSDYFWIASCSISRGWGVAVVHHRRCAHRS
jgi:hypothetical protein